jgi:hypothetical protein
VNTEHDFDFEERAAIMEYDGKLPRPQAERKARLVVDYFRRKQSAGKGMTVGVGVAVGLWVGR